MDGPNVNWTFHDTLAEFRREENPDCPCLIVIGSCGLHVVHGAYQTGLKATDWEQDKNLKAAYGIFIKISCPEV